MVDGLAQQSLVVASNGTYFFHNMANGWRNLLHVPLHSGNPLFEESSGIQTKVVHLDFPKFDGEDPKGWLYKSNQIFYLEGML